jgi:serine/threonine protein kinase
MSDIEYTEETYLGLSLEDETITENKDFPQSEHDDVLYDFLSFLALVSSSTAETEWSAMAMNMIHITTSNVTLWLKRRQGSSFSVSLVDRKELDTILPQGMAHFELPRVLAVKTPILDSDLGTRRNRHIFDSMTREYQILNHKSLKNHENIVSLIGCCWRTVDIQAELTVPNLVLEGADFGDLEEFYQQHGQKVTMRRRLGLCIDVALGLESLNLAGILHGDIKPSNILVFKNKDRGFIAKLADFGSSIPLHNSKFPRRACPGTPLFAAPETVGSSSDFSKDGLLKAEIYTLGLVFVFLVRGPHILDKLRSASWEDVMRLKFCGGLLDWIQQDEEQLLFDAMSRPTFGKNAKERQRQRNIQNWFSTQEYNKFLAFSERHEFPIYDSSVDDKDWLTLRNDCLKDEKSEILFSNLVRQITSENPSQRPTDVYCVLHTLREILTLELHDLYDLNRKKQRLQEEKSASIRRKLNPEGLHEGLAISTLNSQERDSITLNYFFKSCSNYRRNKYRRVSLFREFAFIWKFGGIAKFLQKHRSSRTRRLGVRVSLEKRYVSR